MLQKEHLVAVVRLDVDWFALLHPHGEGKTTHLVLSLLHRGEQIPWFAPFKQLLEDKKQKKKSVWVRGAATEDDSTPNAIVDASLFSYAPSGIQGHAIVRTPKLLQLDIQRVVALGDGLPQKRSLFFRDLNRLRVQLLTFQMPSALQFVFDAFKNTVDDALRGESQASVPQTSPSHGRAGPTRTELLTDVLKQRDKAMSITGEVADRLPCTPSKPPPVPPVVPVSAAAPLVAPPASVGMVVGSLAERGEHDDDPRAMVAAAARRAEGAGQGRASSKAPSKAPHVVAGVQKKRKTQSPTVHTGAPAKRGRPAGRSKKAVPSPATSASASPRMSPTTQQYAQALGAERVPMSMASTHMTTATSAPPATTADAAAAWRHAMYLQGMHLHPGTTSMPQVDPGVSGQQVSAMPPSGVLQNFPRGVPSVAMVFNPATSQMQPMLVPPGMQMMHPSGLPPHTTGGGALMYLPMQHPAAMQMAEQARAGASPQLQMLQQQHSEQQQQQHMHNMQLHMHYLQQQAQHHAQQQAIQHAQQHAQQQQQHTLQHAQQQQQHAQQQQQHAQQQHQQHR